MYTEIQENVLIEPSLLVDERTLNKVTDYLHQYRFGERYKFFIPSKFVYLLSDAERNVKNILFFANSARMVDLKELKALLEKEVIAKFEIQPRDREKHSIFYENLLAETQNEVITEILFEEWIFLQEKSWIISRLKKPFVCFVKAGSASLELGKRALDRAVRKTLKKPAESIITNAERLRALAKWIAVGGSPVLTIFNPIVGAIGGVATGYFLLIDPKHCGHKRIRPQNAIKM
jgi:hypothetical protein